MMKKKIVTLIIIFIILIIISGIAVFLIIKHHNKTINRDIVITYIAHDIKTYIRARTVVDISNKKAYYYDLNYSYEGEEKLILEKN